MQENIASIRQEYSLKTLSENEVHPDPIQQFDAWWKEVLDAEVTEPDAMTLATASSDGLPSARIMLLKEFNKNGFVFFTNYNSYKSAQLNENPKACLIFFWKELERQVRIIGIVEKLDEKENDAYFNSRPEGSRIGAWASPQSQVIKDRKWLEDNFGKLVKQMEGTVINRPEHWGGYVVKPVFIEFWQGRPNRLHDRIQYSLEENGSWKIERLAP